MKDEVWTNYIPVGNIQAARVAERVQFPLRQKLNPFWWWGNVDDPNPPLDFMKEWRGQFIKPVWGTKLIFAYHYQWLRSLVWTLRNPGHNFAFYVIGVADRNYTVRGNKPVRSTLPRDAEQTGWWRKRIELGWFKLPFFSFSSEHIDFYIGWRPSGAFGVKFVRKA